MKRTILKIICFVLTQAVLTAGVLCAGEADVKTTARINSCGFSRKAQRLLRQHPLRHVCSGMPHGKFNNNFLGPGINLSKNHIQDCFDFARGDKENSVKRRIGRIFDEIEQKAKVVEANSRGGRFQKIFNLTKLEIYMLQLRLLEEMGILSPQKRLINVLSGVDFFSANKVGEILMVDDRYEKNKLVGLFYDFVNKLGILFPLPICENKIKCIKEDVATFEFFDEIMPEMQIMPDDIILFKFAYEHLTRYLKAKKEIFLGFSGNYTEEDAENFFLDYTKDWIKQFFYSLPEGVVLIIYEYPKTQELISPAGLANKLLETGWFVDTAAEILVSLEGNLYERFTRMNEISISWGNGYDNYLHVKSQLGEEKNNALSLCVGGKISVLKKVQKNELKITRSI